MSELEGDFTAAMLDIYERAKKEADMVDNYLLREVRRK
jgi:hypothetical protein